MSASAPPEPEPGDRTPPLGRLVAIAFAALFVMVALGVFWVWQRASREQNWRNRVTTNEPFTPPRSR